MRLFLLVFLGAVWLTASMFWLLFVFTIVLAWLLVIVAAWLVNTVWYRTRHEHRTNRSGDLHHR